MGTLFALLENTLEKLSKERLQHEFLELTHVLETVKLINLHNKRKFF